MLTKRKSLYFARIASPETLPFFFLPSEIPLLIAWSMRGIAWRHSFEALLAPYIKISVLVSREN